MDVKFINPFLHGTVDVLKKMAFINPRPGKIYLKDTSNAYGDISGIIGITGDAIGSLAISFKEGCICDIMSRMLGETYTEANQDIFDGVGEITNMISGAARTHMEKEGLTVYAAIPSIIYGKSHTINHILNSPSIVIPFDTDKGSFVVDVCIKKSMNENKTSADYQVVNLRTPVASKAPDNIAVQTGNGKPAEAAPELDKKTRLQNKLKEINAIRDELMKQLSEKPFMEISKRQLFKKRIPLLDAQIKRLRLDIATIEALANLSKEDVEKPKIAGHYQHYDSGKRKS